MPKVRRAFRTKSKFAIDVGDYGLIGDGGSHPLSQRYGSLAAAQDDYYFATSLTQQIDYCSCKSAFNDAFGSDLELLTAYVNPSETSLDATYLVDDTQNWTVNEHRGRVLFRKFGNGFVTSVPIASNTATEIMFSGPMPFGLVEAYQTYAIGYGEHGSNSELNRPVYIPGSRCQFGNDTLTVRNLDSGRIYGEAKLGTSIFGNKTLIAIDGIWYSRIQDLALICVASDAIAAFEIDGNIPGHAYDTRGVQGITLQDMLIDGGGGLYSFAFLRQGGSGGQGDQCTFINVHLSNSVFAPYYQVGYNALSNQFIGGNVQSYTKHGMYAVGGTIGVYFTAFQSVSGYKQIENDGYDIRVGQAGAFNGCSLIGIRTESLRLLRNEGAVSVHVAGCTGNSAMAGWFPGVTYGAAAAHYKAILDRPTGRLFATQVEGTSGLVEPDWASVPEGGTIADNDIVWVHIPFEFIHNKYGSLDRRTTRADGGTVASPRDTVVLSFPAQGETTAEIALPDYVSILDIDATTGPKVVHMVPPDLTALDRGRIVTIHKNDLSLNPVTMTGSALGGVLRDVVIPGGFRGSRTFFWNDWRAGYPAEWKLIASSEALEDTPPLTYTAAHTITLEDNHQTIQMNSASPAAFTLDPDTMPIGAYVEMVQIGAGLMSVAAGAGVTLEPAGELNSQGRWKAMSAFQRSLNNWIVIGGVA